MDLLGNVLSFLMFIMVIRFAFSLMVGIGLTKKRRKWQQQARQDSKIQEVMDEAAIEVVQDEYCKVNIPKEDAYIAVIDDERHYFCSWECRQKYLEEMA